MSLNFAFLCGGDEAITQPSLHLQTMLNDYSMENDNNRLLVLLNELYNLSQQQILRNEKVGGHCRELLKPWPQNEQRNSRDEEAKSKELNQQPNVNQSNASVESTSSPAEMAELSVIKDALAKAQKVRETQTKGKGSQIASSRRPMSGTSKERQTFKNPPLPQIPSARKQMVPQLTKTVKETKGSNNDQEVGIISESHLKRILPPSNANKVSRNSKIKPAHTTAPFKTETASSKNLRARVGASTLRKTRPPGSLNSGASRTGSAGLPRGKSADFLPKVPKENVVRTAKLESKPKALIGDEQGVQKYPRTLSRDMPKEGHHLNSNQLVLDNVSAHKDNQSDSNLHQTLGNLTLNEKDTNISEKPKAFLLKEDGNKLAIPSKLRRFYMKNVHLQQKVKATLAATTANRDTTPAVHFMSRLEEKIDTMNEQCGLRGDLAAKKLGHDYHKLRMLLESLQPETCTETSSWKCVLHQKRLLEMVLAQFHILEDSFAEIIKDEHISFEKKIHISKSITEPPSWLWLPNDLQNVNIQQFLNAGPPSLKYHRVKDMLRYYSLLHKLQLLVLEQSIQIYVGEELVHILHDMDPCDNGSVQLFRGVHSLLCSGGRYFPTLVTNEISSDDEEGDDGNAENEQEKV